MIDAHEETLQHQWEITRAICFNIHAYSMMDKKDKKRSPQKFWPFPWDEKEVKADSRSIIEQHARMVAIRKQLENKN